jgi:prepilin-type N-terminal cleavage/methylation domain-containing protein
VNVRKKRGFTLIELMVVLAIIALIAAIAIPNLIQSRKYSQETSAIESIKTITTAETLFRERDADGNNLNDYASLAQLSQTQLIDSVLGTGTKHGYLFSVEASTPTPLALWFLVASPALPGATGDRYFECNQSATIFYTTTGAFTLNTTDCSIASNGAPIGK